MVATEALYHKCCVTKLWNTFRSHTNLNHLKRNVRKRIATLTEDYTLEVNNLHVHWYLALHDMIASKLYVEPQVKLKKPRPKTTIKIKFVNKGIELINLPNILHDKLLLSTFPNHLAGKYEPPTVISP